MVDYSGSLERRAPVAERQALRRLILGGLVAALIWPAGWVAAARENQGYAISPAFQELTLKAGESQLQYTVKVTNQSPQSQVFALTAVDFKSLDETGGVAFVGKPARELDHKYGLASWMRLDQSSVTVKPGETVDVAAAIENRDTLAPGGHYGAVLATAATDAGGATGQFRVGLRQVLSSLVLLIKEGGSKPDLKLAGQTTDGDWLKLPTRSEQRFYNAGGVHVVPRGVVAVNDPTGKVVVRGALNEASGVILPESYRRYQTALTQVARAWMPGRYTVETMYRYDGTEQTKRFVSSFFYAGSPLVWGGLAGLLLVAAGMIWARRRGFTLPMKLRRPVRH